MLGVDLIKQLCGSEMIQDAEQKHLASAELGSAGAGRHEFASPPLPLSHRSSHFTLL